MEQSELRGRIRELLGCQHVLTLCLADSGGPWAAPVYYAGGGRDGFDLYFLSDPSSRHGQAISAGAPLAAAVHEFSSDWREIRGLQMAGEAFMLGDGPEVQAARKSYVERYPFTESFLRQEEQLEPEIRELVAGVRFYRFRPQKIVLVDNSVRFGFHAELSL